MLCWSARVRLWAAVGPGSGRAKSTLVDVFEKKRISIFPLGQKKSTTSYDLDDTSCLLTLISQTTFNDFGWSCLHCLILAPRRGPRRRWCYRIGWMWKMSSDLMFWPNMDILAPLEVPLGSYFLWCWLTDWWDDSLQAKYSFFARLRRCKALVFNDLNIFFVTDLDTFCLRFPSVSVDRVFIAYWNLRCLLLLSALRWGSIGPEAYIYIPFLCLQWSPSSLLQCRLTAIVCSRLSLWKCPSSICTHIY